VSLLLCVGGIFQGRVHDRFPVLIIFTRNTLGSGPLLVCD